MSIVTHSVFMKLLLFFTLSICVFVVSSTTAYTYDPRCMPEEECKEIHTDFFGLSEDDLGEIWIPDERACGNVFDFVGEEHPGGFCIALQGAETQVSFFGQTSFENLGVFIAYLYRISFVIAMALLTVLLIASGIQWTLSGGGEAKGAAQKRIAQSIGGLVLLAASWLILNTINPALVTLRLPNTYIVRPNSNLPLRCEDIAGDRGFAEHVIQGPTREADTIFSFSQIVPSSYQPLNSYYSDGDTCGNKYFIEQGNGQMCRSHYCSDPNHTCGMWDRTSDQYTCAPIHLALFIGDNNFSSTILNIPRSVIGTIDNLGVGIDGDWEWPYTDDVSLHEVCKKSDGSYNFRPGRTDWFVANQTIGDKTNAHLNADRIQQYYWELETDGVNADRTPRFTNDMFRCDRDETSLGYVLKMDMNKAGLVETAVSTYVTVRSYGVLALAQAHVVNPAAQFSDQTHFIGVNNTTADVARGVDLGNAEVFNTLLETDVVDNYFIQAEQLQKGLRIVLQVKNVFLVSRILNTFTSESDEVLLRAYGDVGYREFYDSQQAALIEHETAQAEQNNILTITGEQQRLYNAYATCFATNRIQSCNTWDSLPSDTRQDVIDNLDVYRQGYRCYWAMRGSSQYDRQSDCAHLQTP